MNSLVKGFLEAKQHEASGHCFSFNSHKTSDTGINISEVKKVPQSCRHRSRGSRDSTLKPVVSLELMEATGSPGHLPSRVPEAPRNPKKGQGVTREKPQNPEESREPSWKRAERVWVEGMRQTRLTSFMPRQFFSRLL